MQIAMETMRQARKHIDCFADPSEIKQSIQTRAFEIYEQRGGKPGHDLEDWLQAEEEVLGLSHDRQRCIQ